MVLLFLQVFVVFSFFFASVCYFPRINKKLSEINQKKGEISYLEHTIHIWNLVAVCIFVTFVCT